MDEALGLVRLPGFGARYPAQLSGGQQQRVALARALVVRPAVLLLDEPLSNLDARLRDEMRTEVREIQRTVGITTILVTHDLHEAFAMADRLAVMSAGRVEQVGPPGEIYAYPATRFVADFTGDANHFEGCVADVTDGVAIVTAGGGLKLRVAAPAAGLAAGRDIAVMIRPERVRVAAAPAGLANAFAGAVEQATYLGALTTYRIRCGDLRLLAQAQTLGPPFRAGDQVVVEWGADDCAVRA